MLIPEAERSKARVSCRSLAGTAGSNPAWDMDVLGRVVCFLCDGPITSLEESYRVRCSWVWLWTLDNEGGGLWPTGDSCAMKRNIIYKGKFVRVHAMKTWIGGLPPPILNLDIRWRLVYNFAPRYSCEGDSTGYTNLLVFLENRKISWLCWDSNTGPCSMHINFVYELRHLGSMYYTGRV